MDIRAVFWSIPKARKILSEAAIMPKPRYPHSLIRKESNIRATMCLNGVNLHENEPNVKYVDRRHTSE